MDGWKNWEGKKVFIRLKTGRVYSGVVKQIDNDTPRFLWLVDKYDNDVNFSLSEILVIQEEKDDRS